MTKILVIEDEGNLRNFIADILYDQNYDVITAENGFEGLLRAREHLPDLIVCDVIMPKLDGRDVLRALFINPLTAAIPFILISDRADRADIRLGMELGADDFIAKPFTRSELLVAISTRLFKNQLIKQQYRQAQAC